MKTITENYEVPVIYDAPRDLRPFSKRIQQWWNISYCFIGCSDTRKKRNSSVHTDMKNSNETSKLHNSYQYARRDTFIPQSGVFFLAGFVGLLFTICIGAFLMGCLTKGLEHALFKNLLLVNNSERAIHWMDPGHKFDTLLKVHIFNYTNVDRYANGLDSRIIVKDIGPFTYKEHTTKVNVTFNSNYTVTFREHRSLKFLPDLSSCLDTENVIVPNVPLLSASAKITEMIGVKRWLASLIFKRERGFKKLTAHEYLWGYADPIISLDSKKKTFGVLMTRNGTSVDSLQMNTGEDDLDKLSIVTQFNGMSELNYWNSEYCNRIDGSDPTMYQPSVVNNRGDILVFLQVLCRRMRFQFESEVRILENIPALRYRTPLNVFGDPSSNAENSCYCEETKYCLPSGLINATKCFNNEPIFPSFPHFFSGDEKLYSEFDGIHPDASLHQTYADIHPRLAFPISGALRIQINIMLHKSEITNYFERLPDHSVLPLMWIELTSGEMTEDILNQLYLSIIGIDVIQYILQIVTLVTCFTLSGLIFANISQLLYGTVFKSKIKPTSL